MNIHFLVWEGGVRATAFVSGGYLPEKQRGKLTNSMIHIADWYTTFCEVLGIDPVDKNGDKHGLPPVEGYNVWPIIMGINDTSPRTQVVIDESAIIIGDYKLIISQDDKIIDAGWTGEIFPNSTSPDHPLPSIKCENGCLFNVVKDMTEHNDISGENKDLIKSMNDTLNKEIKTFFNNNDVIQNSCPKNESGNKCACWMAVNKYNGFYGPFCEVEV